MVHIENAVETIRGEDAERLIQFYINKNSFIMRLEEERYKAFENLRISHTII